MIKLKDILREIGDTSAGVYGDLTPSQSGNGYYRYDFTTESGLEYIAHVVKSIVADEERPVITTEFIVAFEVKGQDWHADTNKGELYKVMATVVNFVRRVVESDSSSKDDTEKAIVFVPSKKDPNDDRRLKLYKAYLKKQITGVEVEGPDEDGRYKAYLPKK